MNTTYCPKEPSFSKYHLNNLSILGVYFLLFIYINKFKFCVPGYEKASFKTLLFEIKCLIYPYTIMFINIFLLYDLNNFLRKINII